MVNLYRRTIKRIYPLHAAIHLAMTAVIIPLLERLRGFKTMLDDPLWFRWELVTGQHERATLQHFRRIIQPGMTMLDIGAHVGFYSTQCAKLVGESGQIIGFEPHPRTFQTLAHNTRPYPQIRIQQAALSNQAGTAELYDYLMMSASGSLHYDEKMLAIQKAAVEAGDIAPRIAEDFPMQRYEVQTVVLDDFLSEIGVKSVDVIKMDIEGAELNALRGMRQTIATAEKLWLIMEYNPAAWATFGHDPQAALVEIFEMGFRQMSVIGDDGSLTNMTGDAAAADALTQRLISHMGVVNLLLER